MVNKMECFTVYADEVEGRIDPHFYRPELIKTYKKLYAGKHEIKQVKDFSKVICGPFGSSIKVKDYKGSGVPLVRIANINENQELTQENTIFITEELAQKLKSYKVKKDDLIISQRGTLGLIVKITDFFDGGIISANFIAIKNLKGILPDYLKVFLSSQYGQMQLVRRTSGQVQTKITTDDIKSLIIPLPPLETQNKIIQLMDAAYSSKKSKEFEAQKLLDSINDYVLDELGIKLPELKDKMTYVVYADDVKGKRIDAYYYQPKFEEVEKAIKNGKFEVKELKEFITKIHYGASVKNEYVDKGIPLLRIMNLKPNKFDLRDIVKLPESMKKDLGNAFVKEGDLLISRSGTVGIVSVVPKEADGFAFGSFMIKFCLNDKVNKNYISAWLNTKLQKLLTEREKIGAIQGNITIGTIENLKIPLPPLPNQNKIADEVKARMQKAEQLQKEAKEELEKAKAEVEKIILGSEI